MRTESVAKRTNSLGRAAVDCWSCQRASRDGLRTKRCDRQRPRCNVCTEAGKVCSGYRQEIQWQGGASRANWKIKSANSQGSPEHSSPMEPVANRTHSTPGSANARYEFIREKVEADYIDTSFGHTVDKLENRRHRPNSAPMGVTDSYERGHSLLYENVRAQGVDGLKHVNLPRQFDRQSASLPALNLAPSASSMSMMPGLSSDRSHYDRTPSWGQTTTFVNPYTQTQHTGYEPSRPDISLPVTGIRDSRSAQDSRIDGSPPSVTTTGDHHFPLLLHAPPVERNNIQLHPLEALVSTSTRMSSSQPQQTLKLSPIQGQNNTPSEPLFQTVRARQSWHEIVGSTTHSSTQTPSSLSKASDMSEGPSDDRMGSERRLSHSSTASYQNLGTHDLTGLQYFDRIICPIPVTEDKTSMINPYREVLQYVSQLPDLREVILDLATRHAETSSMKLNGEKTRESLPPKASSSMPDQRNPEDGGDGTQVDAALIQLFVLMLVNVFQGGRAEWRRQFREVATLLQDRGGLPALSATSTLRTQTAMLVWHDMSVALLERKGCCIPYDYVAMLADYQTSEWSFFSLVGCPAALCLIMHKICDFAARSGVDGTSEDSVKSSRIESFEHELWSYCPANPEDDLVVTQPDLTDGVASNRPVVDKVDSARIDELHEQLNASNAWRYALLLYVSRNLRGRPSSDPRVVSLARRVIDHARLLRPMSGQTAGPGGASKQLLLPLLLAGSEAVGTSRRAYCIDTIDHWHRVTHFKLWLDAKAVLQSLWQRQVEHPDDDINLVDHLSGNEWLFA